MTDAAPTPTTPTRRTVLRTGLATAPLLVTSGSAAAATSGRPGYPFTLGVASGEPAPDGVVLWTRLATDPLAEDGLGGLGQRRTPVEWELANDERFGRIERRGVEWTGPELGHSVHVELAGLEPGRAYHYRFRAHGDVSPAGRTRTAPPAVRAGPADDVFHLVRAVRARLLHRLRPARRGGAGCRAAPRGLLLRGEPGRRS